ncbi:MAG: metallophosphoesterase [Flavobacteriales bacterium]|nr:metallophosphoesterase [Flavobacteriales bacterium]
MACGLWLASAGIAFAQRSSFNGLEVLPADSTGHYRILIGGHFHGESTNRSGYPAATLLANLDTINELGASLFLSTGDLFMDPENDLPRYQQAFFSKLNVPFFNAPGNHDGSPRSDDIASGEFDLPFDPGRESDTIWFDRVFIADTETDDGSMVGDQLGRLGLLADGFGMRNLFIISHRPIWAEGDPHYSDLFKGNTRSVAGTNFKEDVYPILEKIAEHAHVYWISGSMGGSAPSSIFFQEHAKNITYIQCAIRDEPRDALLIADVYPDSVRWSALTLTGQKLMAPEEYDAAWWAERLGKNGEINWRLLPYLVKSTVLHRAFWWGILVALLLVFVVRRVLRR